MPVTPVTGKFGGAKTWFLVDGYNLIAAKLQSLRAKIESLQEQSDGLGDGWEETTPVGESKAEVAQEGAFFDTSAGNIHAAMSGSVPGSAQAPTRVVTLGFDNNAIGQHLFGFEGAFSHAYEVLAQRGKLQRANVLYTVTGKAEPGVILHALTTETADAGTDAAGTSVDNALDPAQRVVPITSSNAGNDRITTAAPHGLVTGDSVVIAGHTGSTPSINGEQPVTVVDAFNFTIGVDITVGGTGGTLVKAKTVSGGAAYLQMTDLTLGGFTDALVTIRHSADNSVFADLVAFTARTAFGAQRVTVAGTVNRYLAQNLDFRGSGSGPSTKYLAGFARN